MHIISKRKLIEFWSQPGREDAHIPLDKWYKHVSRSQWRTLADIKSDYMSVDYVANNRYVFNISGNKYRIVVVIELSRGQVYIRWVGTHNDYNKIDCRTV